MLTARRLAVTLAMALALALSIGLLGASTAMATDPDPSLGLEALQAKLEAAPTKTLPGYFKTVVRHSTIETIPCTVLAITGEASPDSALIMIKATGSAIDEIGGIAEGMSGSPVYVDDEGVDKVIGAVSYGDEFTVGGTGLATPIEAMLQIQQTYSPQVQVLSTPVMTSEGLINRVIVAPNPQDFKGAAEEGALVAKPLASIFIGGLRADSKAFLDLKADLAAKGLAISARTTPGTGTSSLDTPLVPGASVSALAARGDMWIGSIGTVTYADGDDVLAYGHPAHWLGESDEFLCNAFIDGVWPSQKAPFKLGRPASLKGTVTQDRTAGILGELDKFPAETTITVHAFNTDTGKTADTAVYFPRSFVSQGLLGPTSFAGATYVAGSRLFDSEWVAGSAEETTTIVFGDGTHTYQVVLPNRVDDASELPLAVTRDTAAVVYELDGMIGNKHETVEIFSVDVQVRFSKQRSGAEILGIDVPAGLKTGANRVVVSLAPYAESDTRTVEVTLTVPAGMPLTGLLMATSANDLRGYGRSIAEVYEGLQEWSPSNKLWVEYSSTNYEDDGYYIDSTDTSVTTPWVLQNEAMAHVTTIFAAASPASVAYGHGTRVSGRIIAPYDSLPETASVYIQEAGHTNERLLGIADVTWGSGTFSLSTGPLTSNARIRVHVDGVLANYEYGGEGSTSANGYVPIKVAAAVSVSSSSNSVRTGRSVTLTSRVVPASAAGGRVTFEYYDAGRRSWRAIATQKLAASGGSAKATATWKVLRGSHKLRARYLGGSLNATSVSTTVAVKGT
jgi:hypothetical protein